MNNQDQIDSEIGEALAEMLELKVSKNGRVQTGRGTKSFVGLARSVRNIIADTEQRAQAADSILMN